MEGWKMMAEYIEREAAIEKTEAFFDVFVTKWTDEKVIAWIRNLPTADVVEVKHGRWVKMDTTGIAAKESVWNCSACGYPVGIWTVGSNYCPNCGAKMDGGDTDA